MPSVFEVWIKSLAKVMVVALGSLKRGLSATQGISPVSELYKAIPGRKSP